MTRERERLNYGIHHVQEYIRLLGCWRYAAPEHCVEGRDPGEYRRLLLQVLEVYRHSEGTTATMHRDEARKQLRELGKG